MKVNGKDYPFFIMENNTQIWNHQPYTYIYIEHVYNCKKICQVGDYCV